MRTRLLTVIVALSLAVVGCNAQMPSPDDFGDEVKLRILVDKVMQPEAGWHTEQWMVEEAADAGFNVFSPRRANDLAEVRDVTRWCEEAGMLHIPWMRGTLAVAPDNAEADGRRMVEASGLVDDLWSPNSDELWDWMTEQIVDYAEIGVEMPALFGVFLDYENYAKGTNCYPLSYDMIIMEMFAADQGVDLPELAPAERAPWLEEQNLDEAFEAFQVAHWRERAADLREAVRAVNPQFQFCMYPAPGTKMMLEAVFPEWTSEEVPVILADHITYGRRTSFLPQSGALEQARRLLTERRATVDEIGLPYLYISGIDPVVGGADPEYSGKNAVMISDLTDGYWIFYEGPKYDTTHPEYFQWFTWANEAIAQGEFERQHEPRETPDPWAFSGIGGEGELGFGPDESCIGQTMELTPVKLRRSNLALVSAKAGEPVEVVAQSHRVGASELPIVWEARDMSWELLAEGEVAFGEPGTISFTPEEDGIYAIPLSSGGSSVTLDSSNVPIGIYGARGMRTIGGPYTLYFHVPEGTESFSIGGRSAGQETVRLNIYDPSGAVAATDQTTPTDERCTATAEVPEGMDGAIWTLEIARADTGVTLEDVSLSMS
ncbi:MAG: hypothetical protein ACOCX2_09325, partial [Armatimonadota bacterium]